MNLMRVRGFHAIPEGERRVSKVLDSPHSWEYKYPHRLFEEIFAIDLAP
jgi:hypothetical protein